MSNVYNANSFDNLQDALREIKYIYGIVYPPENHKWFVKRKGKDYKIILDTECIEGTFIIEELSPLTGDDEIIAEGIKIEVLNAWLNGEIEFAND